MKRLSLGFLVLFCSLTFAQTYVITRRIRLHNKPYQPDLVQIPSSLCRNNGTTECPLMDGQKHSICQCVCNKKDPAFGFFYESTFGFYNGTWKCEKNIAVRRHSGCLLALYGVKESHSVLTLAENTTAKYPLSNVTMPGFYSRFAVGVTCSMKAENSTYLSCNGEWKQLNSTLVTKRFRISYGKPDEGIYNVHFRVNSSERFSYPLPSGRVIRLAITCSDRSWESSQCIVVKVQGELECPVPLVPTSSPSAIPRSSTPSSVAQPTTTLSSTAQPSSSTASVTLPPSPQSSTTTVPNVNNPDGGSSSTLFTSTVIGVVLGGVALLVLLVITVVLIAKRRKKILTVKVEHRKNSGAAFVIENESYEGDVFGDGEPHPYVNNNTSVVPSTASSTPGSHVKGHAYSNRRGHRKDSVINKVYEVVEELNQPNSKPPVSRYTTGGQHEATNQSRREPLSNIPESTLYISIKDPHYYNGNNYNNERTESHDAPVYDVLDGPEPYGALRGEDPPAVYSTLFDNPYKEGGPSGSPLYDHVGGVIKSE